MNALLLRKYFQAYNHSALLPVRRPRAVILGCWQALALIFFIGFLAMTCFWLQECERVEIFQRAIESPIRVLP